MPELTLEDMYGHPRLSKVGGVAVPEVVQPDVRQPCPPSEAGEVAPVEVAGVERPAVGLSEHQTLVVVAIPEPGPPPVLVLPVLGQDAGEKLRDGHGIVPVGFGGAPDLTAPEAVELLSEDDLSDDQVDRPPPKGQRLTGTSTGQDDGQVEHVPGPGPAPTFLRSTRNTPMDRRLETS